MTPTPTPNTPNSKTSVQEIWRKVNELTDDIVKVIKNIVRTKGYNVKFLLVDECVEEVQDENGEPIDDGDLLDMLNLLNILDNGKLEQLAEELGIEIIEAS